MELDSRVANYGHAGALKGERLSAAAAQANQPVPVRPFQQRTLQSYFATHAAGLPRAHLGQPDPSAAPKRGRQEQPANGSTSVNLEKEVQELKAQLQKVCSLVCSHDTTLRELEAWCTRTYLFHSQAEVAQEVLSWMEQWKSNLPPREQPHPQGPARHMVAAGLAKWLLQDQARKEAMPAFANLHNDMSKFEDLQRSVQLAFVKTVKDGRVLLKIRPQQGAQSEWNEAFRWIDASLDLLQAESKDVAPSGPLVRALSRRADRSNQSE